MQGRSRLSLFLFVISCLITAVICYWMALNRFVARDEGYFLYAAKLILEGKLLYRDFFFPQPPLLPYLFAFFLHLAGITWVAARVFCALLTLLSIGVIYVVTLREYGRRSAAVAWVLSLVSAGILVWFTTSQAYAFSSALCLLGLFWIRKGDRAFLSGVVISLAVLARFTFAPVALLGLVPCWLSSKEKRLRRTMLYVLGGLVPIIVTLPMILPDPYNFYWHAVGYHSERTEMSEDESAARRMQVFKVLIGMASEAGLGGMQSALLLGAAIAGLIYVWHRNRTIEPFAVTGLVLVIAHLCPSPTYVKYFSVTLPFFIPVVSYLIIQVTQSRIAVLRTILPCLFVAAYGVAGIGDMVRFTQTGDDVIGVGVTNRESWRIESVSAISQRLDQFLQNESVVYTNWPGYLFESKAKALPGTENHFGRAWADQNSISTGRRKRLKIVNRKEIIQSFIRGDVAAALLFIGKGRTNHPTEIDLFRAGATVVDELYYVKLYVPKTQPAPEKPSDSK